MEGMGHQVNYVEFKKIIKELDLDHDELKESFGELQELNDGVEHNEKTLTKLMSRKKKNGKIKLMK